MLKMDNEQIRQIVADYVSLTHGNEEFIRQMRDGEQDDGPYLTGAYAIRDWVLMQMKPAAEEIME